MTFMQRGQVATILKGLKDNDNFIETLKNDLHCFEDGEYCGQLLRSEYLDNALIEREAWLFELRQYKH